MKRKILLTVLSLAALAVLYLLFWPVPVDTAAWQPPAAPPLKGVYESNSRLASAESFAAGGHAPEGVAIDAEGRVYTGLEDGRVVRFQPDGRGPESFADTKGRPLGLQFDRDGNLIVADAYKGLLSVSRDGAVSVLSSEAGGGASDARTISTSRRTAPSISPTRRASFPSRSTSTTSSSIAPTGAFSPTTRRRSRRGSCSTVFTSPTALRSAPARSSCWSSRRASTRSGGCG